MTSDKPCTVLVVRIKKLLIILFLFWIVKYKHYFWSKYQLFITFATSWTKY